MSKVSSQLDSRLQRIEPHLMMRLIVLLDTEALGLPRGKGRGTDRQERVDALRNAAAPALAAIDDTLARFGGERLTPEVNALGAVSVQTIAAGARELAKLPAVKALLEDQPASLVR